MSKLHDAVGKLREAEASGQGKQLNAAEALVTEAQLRLVNRLARSFTGTAAITVGYLLAMWDRMTGSPPEDERERAKWELEGRAPNAIRMYGEWWQLSGLAPVANMLAIGAQMHHFAHDAELSLFEKGLLAPLELTRDVAVNVKEQSFMRGLSDISDLISRQESARERSAAAAITSFIPTIVRRAAILGDSEVRRTRSLWQNIKRNIPFLERTLSVRRNAFGEALERSSGLVATFINPMTPRSDRRCRRHSWSHGWPSP